MIVPFLALAPGGLWNSIVSQTTRPLQIESLGAALLLAAHQVGGLGITMESSRGSQNLVGSLPHALGTVSTALLVVTLLGIWLAAARGPATPERLVRYSAASLVAFVALSKVLSPQFMIWLIPLVPLVRGRRGLVASSLLGLALLLDPALVPDPLLGSRAALRGVPLLGSARARSGAAGAAGGAAGAYGDGNPQRLAAERAALGRRTRRARPRSARRRSPARSARPCPSASAGSRARP